MIQLFNFFIRLILVILKHTFLVRASQVSKEGEESEYPAYGVTGPAKEVIWSQEQLGLHLNPVLLFILSFVNLSKHTLPHPTPLYNFLCADETIPYSKGFHCPLSFCPHLIQIG